MSTQTSIDWDAELKNLLDEEVPDKFLHYIHKDRRDALLLDGGGKMRTLCGDTISISFHDTTFAKGKSSQLPVCPRCKAIYDSLPAGRSNNNG